MRNQNRRAGFVLPAVLGTMVIIGVLVTAGFFVARQEMRMGVATENAGMAFYVAERGASEVLDAWDNSVMEAEALFDETTFTGTTDEGTWSVDVRRIGTQLYFLNSTGVITQGGVVLGGASHEIGMIARHLELGIEPPAAVTTNGGISFNGAPPQLQGNDVRPTGWGGICTGPPQNKVGLLSTDTTGTIDDPPGPPGTAYCGNYINGSPCVDEDAALVNETMEPFYDADYWDYLIDIADHVLSGPPSGPAPSSSGGACDTSDPDNWGGPSDDPSALCGSYFPMIYINTDVTISGGGDGQGILLVDGDLTWNGNGTYVGIVVVKGAFTSSGSPTITGALIAESIDVINGTPTIQYSACGIEQAITMNANVTRVRPLLRRGFIDMSVVGN